MGRRGCGAAISGRDEAAADDEPILNQLSIFDTLDGRLGGLCGGRERVGMSSFLGEVGRDQGGTARPKSGLERRFSLVEVGCAEGAATGIGGGGMRGS